MNKFNRILLASGLAATASLMANSPAFADNNVNVNLEGMIPYSLGFTFTQDSGVLSLPMNPGNMSNIAGFSGDRAKLGGISNASGNGSSGLKITATSTWKLERNTTGSGNSGATYVIPIKVYGESPEFNGGSPQWWQAIPESGGDVTLTITSSSNRGSAPDSSFFIGYQVPADAPPGTYRGSVTFTASDK